MMRWFIPVAILCTAVESAAAQSADPIRATLRVTVVDAVGNPVSHSKVTADPIDTRGVVLGMAIPQCITDAAGRCTLSNLEPWTYRVSASKVEDGYPETLYYFFNSPENPRTTVTFSVDHTEEDLVLPIGKKGGLLRGTVTDAKTGKGINANVSFCWVSNPGSFISGSGLTNAQFRIVVPSGIAFTMVVSQDGYRPWTYTSAGGRTPNAIELGPGEELVLDIRLQPEGGDSSSQGAPRI
jgi:hypothetical protein